MAEPRTLSALEWRKVWDSLDRPRRIAEECRQGCGHLEAAHLFWTETSPDCGANCSRCAS